MGLAVSHLHRAAGGANQLFWVELLLVPGIVHGLGTTLPSSKVGLAAFVALEVGVYCHGVLGFVFVEGRLWITKFGVFILVLVF